MAVLRRSRLPKDGARQGCAPSTGNMVHRFSLVVLSLALLCPGAAGDQDQYTGAEVCGSCHRDIADSQSRTAMANTWHGAGADFLPFHFDEKKTEGNGKVSYQVRRADEKLEFSVASAGKG